eukprot:5799359-Pyramimonas_sp.AAC.1
MHDVILLYYGVVRLRGGVAQEGLSKQTNYDCLHDVTLRRGKGRSAASTKAEGSCGWTPSYFVTTLSLPRF